MRVNLLDKLVAFDQAQHVVLGISLDRPREEARVTQHVTCAHGAKTVVVAALERGSLVHQCGRMPLRVKQEPAVNDRWANPKAAVQADHGPEIPRS